MVDFLPIYSTSRADAVADFVTLHYAISTPVQCRLLNRGLNDVYRLTAASGNSYIFRISHHRARGPADAKTETEFLLHLARHGVPVARPIETRGGDLFLRGEAPEGAREGVLFEELRGRVVDAMSTSDARANGRTLAMLHNAAESYIASNPLYRLDLDHLLHRPLERLRNSVLFSEAASFDEFEAIARRVAERIAAFGPLTHTQCHGDCHGFNARIQDDGSAAFFDFDDGGPGYLAYDLSVFLWAKVSYGRTLHHMWDAFVDGYRVVRPLAVNDFEAAHAFVAVRHIWLLSEHASRAPEWGSEPVSYIPKEISFLRKWDEVQLSGRLPGLFQMDL
jgi:Ser/Thr protein kinase RdoA (MazF antagonist)